MTKNKGTRKSKTTKPRGEANHSLIGLKTAASIIIFLATIGAVALQYCVFRPRMIIDEISQKEESPFDQTFWVKNSGGTDAVSLRVYLRNFQIIDNRGVTVQTRKGDDIRLSSPSLLVDYMDVPPQQKISFKLSEFIAFKLPLKPRAAKIHIYFEYKDFLRVIPYSTDLAFQLVPEKEQLVWRTVGPNYSW
jgi:hypothetical protein